MMLSDCPFYGTGCLAPPTRDLVCRLSPQAKANHRPWVPLSLAGKAQWQGNGCSWRRAPLKSVEDSAQAVPLPACPLSERLEGDGNLDAKGLSGTVLGPTVEPEERHCCGFGHMMEADFELFTKSGPKVAGLDGHCPPTGCMPDACVGSCHGAGPTAEAGGGLYHGAGPAVEAGGGLYHGAGPTMEAGGELYHGAGPTVEAGGGLYHGADSSGEEGDGLYHGADPTGEEGDGLYHGAGPTAEAGGELYHGADPTGEEGDGLYCGADPTAEAGGELYHGAGPTVEAGGGLYHGAGPTVEAGGGLYHGADSSGEEGDGLYHGADPTGEEGDGLYHGAGPTAEAGGELYHGADPTGEEGDGLYCGADPTAEAGGELYHGAGPTVEAGGGLYHGAGPTVEAGRGWYHGADSSGEEGDGLYHGADPTGEEGDGLYHGAGPTAEAGDGLYHGADHKQAGISQALTISASKDCAIKELTEPRKHQWRYQNVQDVEGNVITETGSSETQPHPACEGTAGFADLVTMETGTVGDQAQLCDATQAKEKVGDGDCEDEFGMFEKAGNLVQWAEFPGPLELECETPHEHSYTAGGWSPESGNDIVTCRMWRPKSENTATATDVEKSVHPGASLHGSSNRAAESWRSTWPPSCVTPSHTQTSESGWRAFHSEDWQTEGNSFDAFPLNKWEIEQQGTKAKWWSAALECHSFQPTPSAQSSLDNVGPESVFHTCFPTVSSTNLSDPTPPLGQLLGAKKGGEGFLSTQACDLWASLQNAAETVGLQRKWADCRSRKLLLVSLCVDPATTNPAPQIQNGYSPTHRIQAFFYHWTQADRNGKSKTTYDFNKNFMA
ncbi:uncharacterized protein LOC125447884 isoform X2 [Stegostoma tigrinum]|uniref:uncharacterized protein LOC125447884 isoform X2 n=1 Tax=Stegostoma tigrinum TaxID=3053191 RepID=UPI0028703683|nr:uncharacterized protein LOC125447884 isoform X2 [Stegostoma tigrinum]